MQEKIKAYSNDFHVPDIEAEQQKLIIRAIQLYFIVSTITEHLLPQYKGREWEYIEEKLIAEGYNPYQVHMATELLKEKFNQKKEEV